MNNRQKQPKTFPGRAPLKYDKVLVATGANPRKLPVAGADAKNVLVLRTPED